jgi:hypothetical protein
VVYSLRFMFFCLNLTIYSVGGLFAYYGRHSREGGNPQRIETKILDTRQRGHDIKSSPSAQLSNILDDDR